MRNVVLEEVVTISRAPLVSRAPLKGQSINFNHSKENTTDGRNNSDLCTASQQTTTIKLCHSTTFASDEKNALNFNHSKIWSLIMEKINKVTVLVKEIEKLGARLLTPTPENILMQMVATCRKYIRFGDFYKPGRFLEAMKLFQASFENSYKRLTVLMNELEKELKEEEKIGGAE